MTIINSTRRAGSSSAYTCTHVHTLHVRPCFLPLVSFFLVLTPTAPWITDAVSCPHTGCTRVVDCSRGRRRDVHDDDAADSSTAEHTTAREGEPTIDAQRCLALGRARTAAAIRGGAGRKGRGVTIPKHGVTFRELNFKRAAEDFLHGRRETGTCRHLAVGLQAFVFVKHQACAAQPVELYI